MRTDFRLVDSGWDRVIGEALNADHSALRLICPFIKKRVAERLLAYGRPDTIQLITRFDLADFCKGVSDTAALRLLLENGAKIRGVRNLHAKIYLFGRCRAVVTSANLTESALLRNHEFGFVTEDVHIVRHCAEYFELLWARAGRDLVSERLDQWEEQLRGILAGGARPYTISGLGDEGTDAGVLPQPPILPELVAEAPQAFVKFFGVSGDRAPRSRKVLEEVQRSGCHWACTYPRGKRPRMVKEGAIMFIARLVYGPNDIIVYGRAVAMKYKTGRDDATPADVVLRSWKDKWPHYIRVHHAQFVSGDLTNGVSLGELMGTLAANAFASTRRNAANGQGNVDPRRAYRQQAAVELSPPGTAWLNARLEEAFAEHGKLSRADLEQLDWPAIDPRERDAREQ